MNISENKFTVKVWGISFDAAISPETKLLRRFTGNSSMSEFDVGDIVEARGFISTSTPNIFRATLIRDKSPHKIRTAKQGFIQSISNDSFIMKDANGTDFTVKVEQNTRIISGTEAKTFNDLKINDEVRISGFINTKNNIIIANTIRIRN